MNILLTCCGRKIYLVHELRKALNTLLPGQKHRILVTESYPWSPSLQFADKGFLVQRISDNGYLERIAAICRDESVDILLPSKDLELDLFACAHGQELPASVRLALSNHETLCICKDKLRFHDELHEFFQMPRTALAADRQSATICFPCVIKEHGPGMEGGSGFHLCRDESSLCEAVRNCRAPICQEYIEGTEYTVDALFNAESEPVAIVPRRRLLLRQNVSDVGLSVYDKEMVNLTASLGRRLRFTGPVNVQWIKDQSGRLWLIEANPRISGGLQITLAACPEYLQALTALILGHKVAPLGYVTNVLTMKYDSSVSRRLAHGESPNF